MGDGDVICIDSDDDDDDDAIRNGGGTLGARTRAPNRRGGGGRGYWRQRRRAQRGGRKNDPLLWLSDELQRLLASVGQLPRQSVAQRLHWLVGEFERRTSAEPDRRDEGWRQVLRFLVVWFRPSSIENHPRQADNRSGLVDGISPRPKKDEPHLKSQPVRSRIRCRALANDADDDCQLTVIDILADYIRFRCESVVGSSRPSPFSVAPATLLAECNRIVSLLGAIFAGSAELVTLTLLRTVPDRRHTLLLYPVFEHILTDRETAVLVASNIPSYVRLLLCFKRWRSLVPGRTDKAIIDAQACRFLPARCPTVRAASDLPFLRLLPPVPAFQRANETRFLMANDLFELERCIGQFFYHHRRRTVGERPRVAPIRLTATELSSNYINVALLAELIERKGRLWASEEHSSALHREALSIADSLRLIFRHRTDFIELTLLRVLPSAPGSEGLASLVGSLYEAFLATPTQGEEVDAGCPAPANDMETYTRLLLCYAKWKALCGEPEPTAACAARIDTIALSRLPSGFPRALCPRDVRLRKVFPASGAVAPARTHPYSSTTRNLLRTLPRRADLQELCLKFIAVYRTGPGHEDEEASRIPPHGREDDAHQPPTVTQTSTAAPAYKSMSSSTIGHHLGPRPEASEMKPIIIPDSDDGDETSADGEKRSVRAAGSAMPSAAETLARNITSHAETDVASPAIPGWPPFVECFLNTPPATPQQQQQQVTTEPPLEEDHRCISLVKKSPPPGLLRLTGTLRSIGRRRTKAGRAQQIGRRIGRFRCALRKVFDMDAGGGWWCFADVLAVQLPPLVNARWCSSIIKGRTELSGPCSFPSKALAAAAAAARCNNPQGLSIERGSRTDADHSSQADALLLELLLDASMPFESTAGAVDFSIPPDYPPPPKPPGRAAECGQAPLVDTSPLFASDSDSDRFVHLLTGLGPMSWPIW